jgi:tRNA/rRNA methyltransferase
MDRNNIRIVLVNPLYGGNIGSVCRAMSNMGFSDLAIADPRQIDMNEARMMACHSRDILESVTEFDTLAEAIADCGMVIGTSARRGLYRQHAITPREAAAEVLESAAGGKVAYVFGREDKGLTNDELAMCKRIVRIPTAEENTSLNIAQAAMVCLYETFVASGQYEPPVEKTDQAPSELREIMFGIWRKTLLDIGFMEKEKADHMMYGLRRVLSRGAHTLDDVKIMMGIGRQAEWAAGAGKETRDTGDNR